MSKLIVPTHIPKHHRYRTNSGPWAFCAVYEIEEPICMELRRHAILIAATAPLFVESEGKAITIPKGSALVCGHQDIEISGSGELHLFVFGHNAVRNALGRFRIIETLMFLPDTDFPLVPIRNFYPQVIREVGARPENYIENLTEILQALMLGSVPATAYSYFRRTFYGPRMRMCADLERQLLDPGPISRAFEVEFRKLCGVSTKAWLSQRKAELANHWLRHGAHELGTVADALHATESELCATFIERQHMSPFEVVRSRDYERIKPATLAKIIRPSWMPPIPRWTTTAPQRSTHFLPAEDDGLEGTSTAEPHEVSDSDIAAFWEMKSTGVETIIPLPVFIQHCHERTAAKVA